MLAANFGVAVACILVNKHVLGAAVGGEGFHFPIAITFIGFVVSSFGLAALEAVGARALAPPRARGAAAARRRRRKRTPSGPRPRRRARPDASRSAPRRRARPAGGGDGSGRGARSPRGSGGALAASRRRWRQRALVLLTALSPAVANVSLAYNSVRAESAPPPRVSLSPRLTPPSSPPPPASARPDRSASTSSRRCSRRRPSCCSRGCVVARRSRAGARRASRS